MPYHAQNITNRPLRVFLCHSSNDKPAVRELYQKLCAELWIQPWLDEEELYPGDDWDLEIEKAVENSDVVLVCLSNGSINKRGYVQKELRFALDIALEIPEEEIFIIPLRLEECTPPRSLRDWQYADYFEGKRENAHQRLLVSLKRRANSLGLKFEEPTLERVEKSGAKEQNATVEYLEGFHKKHAVPIAKLISNEITLSNGMEFIRVPAGKFLMGSDNRNDDEKPQHTVDIPYDYWMARFPVTNEQYNLFVRATGAKHPVDDWQIRKNNPVTHVSWNNAMTYCHWMNKLHKIELSADLIMRLPAEAEWEKSARGEGGYEYPWGNEFDKDKCNTGEGGKGGTTSIGLYSPQGDSPYGCSDMAGNVWEWTHSLNKKYPYKANDGREDEKVSSIRVLRGGSFFFKGILARCAYRYINALGGHGFRVCLAPPLPK